MLLVPMIQPVLRQLPARILVRLLRDGVAQRPRRGRKWHVPQRVPVGLAPTRSLVGEDVRLIIMKDEDQVAVGKLRQPNRSAMSE